MGPAAGAKGYRIQVATDLGFTNPVEDSTAATSYTSTTVFDPDTALYWRVRAVDGSDNTLTWSAPRSLHRRLPAPLPDPLNPVKGGATLPTMRWSAVQGAKEYVVRVEQANGSPRMIKTSATAFTPTTSFGRGTWKWQVQAAFPDGVSGPLSAQAAYARSVPAPGKAVARRSKRRVLLSWGASAAGGQYRVEVSTNRSFTRRVDSVTTDLTTWAPDIGGVGYKRNKRLYWRVSVRLDGRSGAWATGQLKAGAKTRAKARNSSFTSAGRRATSPG